MRGEGFEGALSMVQEAHASNKSNETKQRLDRLTQALIGNVQRDAGRLSIS
jgi:hypothetical protein